MSNEMKDRLIRGGANVVMTVAAPGCMTILIGLATGTPGSLHTRTVQRHHTRVGHRYVRNTGRYQEPSTRLV